MTGCSWERGRRRERRGEERVGAEKGTGREDTYKHITRTVFQVSPHL